MGGLFSSCAKDSPVQVEITPIPPPQLQELPRQVEMLCFENAQNNTAAITLWELPGLPSRDPGSSRGSHTGTNVGSILPCSETVIMEYAWSAADQKFYVLVSNDEGIQGWVGLNFITFTDYKGKIMNWSLAFFFGAFFFGQCQKESTVQQAHTHCPPQKRSVFWYEIVRLVNN